MSEVLLVLTLIAAASTARAARFFPDARRSAEREAREELSRSLATFSQMLTVQMGSNATVQNAQFETLRAAVDQQLEHMRKTVDEKLTPRSRSACPSRSSRFPSASSWCTRGWRDADARGGVGDLQARPFPT